MKAYSLVWILVVSAHKGTVGNEYADSEYQPLLCRRHGERNTSQHKNTINNDFIDNIDNNKVDRLPIFFSSLLFTFYLNITIKFNRQREWEVTYESILCLWIGHTIITSRHLSILTFIYSYTCDTRNCQHHSYGSGIHKLEYQTKNKIKNQNDNWSN